MFSEGSALTALVDYKTMPTSSLKLASEALREDEFNNDGSNEDMDEDDGVRDIEKREDEEFVNLLGTDRLVFFSDAVIAISLTLLILPLMEGVQTAMEANQTATEYIYENSQPLWSFLLSFFIINQYWFVHENLFQYVRKYSKAMRMLNVLFLLFIVLLPVNTAAVNQLDQKYGNVVAHVLYVGNLLIIDIILILMNVLVRRDPRMWNTEHTPPTSVSLLILSVTFVVLCAVMVIVSLVPNPQVLIALVSLAFVSPLVLFLHRRSDIVQRYSNFIDRLTGAKHSA